MKKLKGTRTQRKKNEEALKISLPCGQSSHLPGPSASDKHHSTTEPETAQKHGIHIPHKASMMQSTKRNSSWAAGSERSVFTFK